MTIKTISIYHTRTGKEAMRIDELQSTRGVFYSYIGKYGAASGLNFEAMKREVKNQLTYHKGMKFIQGIEF